MTKDPSKTIPWSKIVAEVEEISGIPRKQVDEVSNQIVLGIESIIEKNQPKRDGDVVMLESPFCGYELTRVASHNVVGPDGKQVVRPTCIGLNVTGPRNFIIKANIGLVDRATEEAEKKKAKTA
jgi:hypothetical protein